MMKRFVEWLEGDIRRTRKVLALFTAVVWLVAVVTSYILLFIVGLDTIAILSLVTAQFATVIGFYMATKAEND